MKGACIIPAKGNSRRLPRKNALPLGGRPLVCRAVDSALEAQRFEFVAVSSNDEEILTLAKAAGAEPLVRDQALCGDQVRAKDVVHAHLIALGREFDYVAMLMPTTPLRTSAHVREAVDLFVASGRPCLASVCEYDFHPALALTVEEGTVQPYFGGVMAWEREETHRPAFHLNGAVYLASYTFFMAARTFVAADTAVYFMDRLASLDVDTPEDFRLVEMAVALTAGEM